MQADDVRFLFAYDRWATHRVLSVLDGVDPVVWARTHVVDERGLGGILGDHLGASQRWRIGFQTQGDDEGPEPELEPLPTIEQLRERWDAQHRAEVAALLTAEGRSPGELALIDYAGERAGGGDTET